MKVKVKVKLLSHVRLLATPWTAAHQASPSMGGGRNTYKVWAAEKTTWPEESVGDRRDPKAFRPTQFWPNAKRREATLLTCPEHFTAIFSVVIPFTLKTARVMTSCYRNQNSGLLGPQEWVGWHRSTQEKARWNLLHWQEWAASLQERGPCGVSLHTRADTRLHCTTYRPSVRKEQGRISVWTTNHGPADLREIGKLRSKGGTCLDWNFRKVALPFAGWVLKDETEGGIISEKAFAIMAGSGGGLQLDSCRRKTESVQD